MKDQNNANLLNSLEQLPTSDLDIMLHSELEKEFPAADTVQLILKILREREVNLPVMSNPKIDKAWATYLRETSKESLILNEHFKKVAAILILCSLLLFTIPQIVQAESFFSQIATWTENVFELFDQWNQGRTSKEYIFQTEHPGLQELYNTVTELGVVAPVVPMYLDNDFILESCEKLITPTHNKVIANFSNNNKVVIYELNIYLDIVPREFHKNIESVSTHESNGIIHYIFRNNDLWTVVWTKDYIECAIAIDCSESDLYHIIDSIYASEE